MRPPKQATPTYSSRTADKFVVRLPEGMREQIAEVARSHHRSMNPRSSPDLEQSPLQEGALQDNLGVRRTARNSARTSASCCSSFRQLTHRQQNALVALIAHDAELAQA